MEFHFLIAISTKCEQSKIRGNSFRIRNNYIKRPVMTLKYETAIYPELGSTN